MANFKALSTASYKLSSKYNKCKRNIKYDDEVNDLVLDFKLDATSPWKRLRAKGARELIREEGGSAEEVSTADMSEILNAPDEEEEQDLSSDE